MIKTPTKILLRNTQANILRYHGRKNARCLFLKFSDNELKSSAIRKQIKMFVTDQTYGVTSAWAQREDSKLFKENDRDLSLHPGMLITCFYISAAGYRKLSLEYPSNDFSFRTGMKDWQNRVMLGDNHDD